MVRKSARRRSKRAGTGAVGEIGEVTLESILLMEGFELFIPAVDAGVDFLAFSPSGQMLRIQSKARSADQDYLWDITVGQRSLVGPPTHFFFIHGTPPTDDYWLVPAPVVRKVWLSPKPKPDTRRVILSRRVRDLFQPFKKEAGFRAARTWEPEE
jgi:hypothetical protein